MESFLNELGTILKPDQIKTDAESTKYYGKDWTTYFDIKAGAILFPTSTDEVSKIVIAAKKNKIALIPSGGRTGLSGAACALNGEAVVSFEKMNRILDFNEIDQTVHCQAGVIIEELQNFAQSKGLYYGVDFAARGSAHLGGSIATNAGGIKVLRYGLTRDWVMSLTVVTGTGEVLSFNNSLIKNATGYDFRHLFIGSEGTLGFITEATMKLSAPPPPLQVMIVGAESLKNVMNIFSSFKTKCTIVAFEMFSDKALKYVMDNTQLPAPFATTCPYYVLIELENKSEKELEQILTVFEECLEAGWAHDGVMSHTDAQAKTFWRYREQISESLSKYSPYKNDISVRIAEVPSFVKELDTILAKNYPTWEVVWFGHIGDGNLHINILRPADMSKEDFVKECQKVDPLVFDLIKKHKGSISAEHGVGLTKKMFLDFTRSKSEIEFMKGIKKLFDPEGIINPGKVF